jgi:hypothetical protein
VSWTPEMRQVVSAASMVAASTVAASEAVGQVAGGKVIGQRNICGQPILARGFEALLSRDSALTASPAWIIKRAVPLRAKREREGRKLPP